MSAVFRPGGQRGVAEGAARKEVVAHIIVGEEGVCICLEYGFLWERRVWWKGEEIGDWS